MNGRRYRLVSPVPAGGTHASSTSTSARSDATKSSVGSSGRARRRALRCIRSALASGRNDHTEPSACR